MPLKYLFAILMLGVTVVACGHKTKPKLKPDINIAAEEKLALPHIRFGITPKLFTQTKNSSVTQVQNANGTGYVTDYKFYDCHFTDCVGEFTGDSLYMVLLPGFSCEEKDYQSKMPEEYKKLRDALEDYFGEPNTDEGLPDWKTMDEQHNITACSTWSIGKKNIQIRVSRQSDYSLSVLIYQTEMWARVMKGS